MLVSWCSTYNLTDPWPDVTQASSLPESARRIQKALQKGDLLSGSVSISEKVMGEYNPLPLCRSRLILNEQKEQQMQWIIGTRRQVKQADKMQTRIRRAAAVQEDWFEEKRSSKEEQKRPWALPPEGVQRIPLVRNSGGRPQKSRFLKKKIWTFVRVFKFTNISKIKWAKSEEKSESEGRWFWLT